MERTHGSAQPPKWPPNSALVIPDLVIRPSHALSCFRLSFIDHYHPLSLLVLSRIYIFIISVVTPYCLLIIYHPLSLLVLSIPVL